MTNVKLERQDALLKRVTGKGPGRPAPAAVPPPETGGQQLPFPSGKPVNWDELDPAHRDALKQMGFEKDSIVSPVAMQMAESVVTGKRTTAPETVDITSLSPEKQKRVTDALNSAKAEGFVVENDLDKALAQGLPPTAAKPAAVPRDEAPADTGAATRPACPHCGWDTTQVDIPEPDDGVKIAFLHCVLGGKPFVKDYELFGGKLIVTFRSLTAKEIDAVYRQTSTDKTKNRIAMDIEFVEKINRYRLALQLQRIRSVEQGLDVAFPAGLDKASNPTAVSVYEGDADDETLLPMVEQYVEEKALKTETLFRVIHGACNQFNRLVAKLEALADNPDFWNGTASRS